MTSWHEPSPDGVPIRPTARVLLLDETDCTLLFCALDHERRRFWFTPGGGADPGETPEATALRELQEETGLIEVPLGPELWRWTIRGSFDGVLREFRERWYLARIDRFELDTSGFNQLERDTILEHRWWSLAELRACSDRLVPEQLADLLASLLETGPSPEPIDLTPNETS